MKKLNVLYLDDDELLLETYSTVLSEYGHNIHSFLSPELAIENLQASETPYDVLLIDYSMPTMSGIDFIITLKKHNFFEAKEIALFSSHPKEMIEKKMQIQAPDLISKIDYIYKGYGEFKDILTYIQSVLSRV